MKVRGPGARRLPRANLWVFHAFDDAGVHVLAIVDQPPVPIEE